MANSDRSISMTAEESIRLIRDKFTELRNLKPDTTILRDMLNDFESRLIQREQEMHRVHQGVQEFTLECQKKVETFSQEIIAATDKVIAGELNTPTDVIEHVVSRFEKMASDLDTFADRERPAEDYKATHLMSWLQQGYFHCRHGSQQWAETYLNSARNYIAKLEFERDSRFKPCIADYPDSGLTQLHMADEFTIVGEEVTVRVTRDAHLKVNGFVWDTAAIRQLTPNMLPPELKQLIVNRSGLKPEELDPGMIE